MRRNAFLRGMASINLLPKEKKIGVKPISINILSDEEAFKKDLEQVGNDMWYAVEMAKTLPEIKQRMLHEQRNDRSSK